ncbi:HIRAN domain-containing protein [Schinkia azotoformans MEV2011]|uniref:HIRAN domain-containing protein n=1 Tax=Schinkia azotoformans MEV2011 TaxID=1348973 RepID=A0A072P1H7_SCHAZ|nr:HIRAN domain-containing protein [Schinkia azotoformans]KEF39345.1 HIRAN domain-containing protein [Schinkia azotoformans MEV2011]MEC1694902.1 HIRAN domain-containing protein [Schinkia azotoformans]MEC1725513.1 HIRAN domain-containing protein [Schinkia azotoformans]MEC1770680.1 HIRAN domain-containing protein [Schinkia azotoformans]MED4368400.1 HIRAN domain-containing protein [Schinkia azotoformans]
MHEEVFVTIVGSRHYKGSEIFRVGQIVRLVKDFENSYDDEAIAVELEPFGKVGYVANSTSTVARGTKSAGRIYDSFDDERYGLIRFILKGDAIVELIDYHEFSLLQGEYKVIASFFNLP